MHKEILWQRIVNADAAELDAIGGQLERAGYAPDGMIARGIELRRRIVISQDPPDTVAVHHLADHHFAAIHGSRALQQARDPVHGAAFRAASDAQHAATLMRLAPLYRET
jgi:hypothetical protein